MKPTRRNEVREGLHHPNHGWYTKRCRSMVMYVFDEEVEAFLAVAVPDKNLTS
jgi:hypothetical protein